jgi:hypothetical protein
MAIAAAPLPEMVYGTKALPEPVKVMEDFESHRAGEKFSVASVIQCGVF